MREAFRFQFALTVFCMFAAKPLPVNSAELLDYWEGWLFSCDPKGHAVSELPLGEISLGKVTLPVCLQHSSNRSHTASAELPPHWNLAIFDSCIQKVDETAARILLPDSSIAVLSINPSPAGEIDDSYSLKIDRNSASIKHEGVLYRFEDGRLKSIESETAGVELI